MPSCFTRVRSGRLFCQSGQVTQWGARVRDEREGLPRFPVGHQPDVNQPDVNQRGRLSPAEKWPRRSCNSWRAQLCSKCAAGSSCCLGFAEIGAPAIQRVGQARRPRQVEAFPPAAAEQERRWSGASRVASAARTPSPRRDAGLRCALFLTRLSNVPTRARRRATEPSSKKKKKKV